MKSSCIAPFLPSPSPSSVALQSGRSGTFPSSGGRGRPGTPLTRILLLLCVCAPTLLGIPGCRLPGPRSVVVEAETPGLALDRCAAAAEQMHFRVKAVDRSHNVVVAEGQVEGGLSFHEIRLSIKVIHLEGRRFKVEAIATGDEHGIRAGAEKKARQLFFRELRKTTDFVDG